MKRSSRLAMSRFLPVFIGLLLAGGCVSSPSPMVSPSPPSPSPFPTATPAATVDLTVWHTWDAAEEALYRRLLADYRRQHPQVVVHLRRFPVGEVLAEYEAAVVEGTGPDLLVGWSHWIAPLAERQALMPLEDLLEQDFWASFYPFALEGVRAQGHLYAAPYACETVALYYNRDFVLEPPTNTAALLDLAATWPGQEQAGLAYPLSFYNTVGYLYAFGGRLLDEEGRPALDTLEMRAWLRWLQTVQAAPGVVATGSYGQADTLFKSGVVAMAVNGSWVLPDYLQALGSERLGVAPLPMLSETGVWPGPLVGYRVLLVNPALLSAHPQATLDLLRFLSGPQLQEERLVQLGEVPTWRGLDLSSRPLQAAFVRQAELGRPRPLNRREEALWDPLESLLYNVLERRMPLEQALQETLRKVESLEEGEAAEMGP
ncbi:MAG: sugar ABC transporter substrate-binding protein [Chloroflexia bacterium]